MKPPTGHEAAAIIHRLREQGALQSDNPEGSVTPVSLTHQAPDQQQGAQSDTSDTSDTGTGRQASARTSWTAAELVALEFPEPRWAVPGLVAEGVSVFAGPPKVGKSWLMLGVGLAVASGGIALSSIEVEQGEVLYLALEDTPRRLKRRLVTMLQGDPAPEGLTLKTACPTLADGGADRIGIWLDQHPDARLVVVDVFARIRGAIPTGISGYDADYQAVAKLKKVADAHSVAMALVHHVRKMDADDFLDTVSGTNGLTAAADQVLVLKRSRGKADAVLHLTGRDVEEAEHAMEFTPALGLWKLLEGPVLDYTLGETRLAILRWLREHGPAKPKTIAEATGLEPATVRQACPRMVDDGQLDTDGAGTYSVSPASLFDETAGQDGDSE